MATCVDLAEAEYPKAFDGERILPMEGESIRPLFSGSPDPSTSLAQRSLYWEHEGNAAIRIGDRKLVRLRSRGPWELYDMKADCTEQHDLAGKHAEEVRKLAAQWEKWAKRTGVLPKPARKKKAKTNNKKNVK